MKLLVLDIEGEGTGVDLAYRAKEVGHEVRYWLPITRGGNRRPYGDGLLDKPREWRPSMDWADLVVVTGNNKYQDDLAEYFGKGYPIFGTNAKAASLELDRGYGQEVLADHGVKIIPYKIAKTAEEAVAHIAKEGTGFALKPWGGDANSAMTHVAKDADEAVFTIRRWQAEGLFKGQLMMQELVEGVEMGISGFFGPGGWSRWIEESFEHKKFLTGDLGENTGEMGTIIRHVEKSKLFDMVLGPLTDYLHQCNYVGDCAVNCIIDEAGVVHPLEFTMRLGWPDFTIRQELVRGDPVEWMLDLVYGKDTFEPGGKVAVGVLMVHGDFPKCKDGTGCWAGYPIEGIHPDIQRHLHYQQVMMDEVPRLAGKKVIELDMVCTAGVYPLVVTGSATTVSNAAKKAYRVVESIKWPSNVMYRTDIGERLKKDLSLVQKHGFAKGMEY
jgi:phosphoribosylamine---glycine ligase